MMRWQNATCQAFAAGASMQKAIGAFFNLLDGTVSNDTPYELFGFGANKFWFATCATSPANNASPGDLLLNAQSASTALWGNTSDGTAGSVWTWLGGTTLDAGSAVGP